MIYDVDDDILSDNWLHLELDADEREREKSSTKSAGDDEQWYARENETELARKIGGTVTEVGDTKEVKTLLEKYLPGQPRDDYGRFAGGGVGGSAPDTGGSYGGGSSGVSVERNPDVSEEKIDWEGDRGSFARDAQEYIQDGSEGIALRKDGDLKGIAAYHFDKLEGGRLQIDLLATKEPGHGRKMVAEACAIAAEKGKGVFLHSSIEAKGFYRRIGMTPNAEYLSDFSFTAKQAAAFAKENLKETIIDDEPKSGVFTAHPDLEKSFTKSLQTQSDPAHTLIQLVFDPLHWKDELINRALPLLAVEMAKAARAQMSEVGIIPQKGTNGELDEKYTPGQSRDDLGRWSSGGGVGGSAPDTGGSFGSSTTSMTATKRNEEGKLMLEDGSPLPGHLPKAIPPAWRDVKVSLNPKSELLVKAKDSKDRVKVIYSDAHDTRTAIAKFARINELRKKQRMIESQVIQDGMGKGKKKEEANCLRLILATGMRPGSHSDTKGDVQAYGATTLQGRHVVVKGDTVSLSYVGKGGKKVDMVITHKAVVKDLIRRKQKAGDEGELFNTNNGKVLRYSKGLNGGGFKTKDFRTAKGTNEALKAMRNVPKPKTMKEYKKAVRKVAKHVSEKLNNTPTVALQSYINPMVFSKWRVNGKS